MACINKSIDESFHCNQSSSMPFKKYLPWCEYQHGLPFDHRWPDRKWPTQRLLRAPRWCSVDLRDGNQALVNPMDVTKKMLYFKKLRDMGFKEIEIGFPSASSLDFDFTRLLIEQQEVPDDLWLMVLVQAREHLIRQTIESLKGARNVIIHLYNSTSELQRRVVFNLPQDGVRAMAVQSTLLIRKLSSEVLIPSGCNVRFEYSPESFTGTEVHFALEVCHAVMDAWCPTIDNPIILNLPETVQNAGPHFYADQIEWMHHHLKDREKIVLSIHPHNDRGTSVASAELALQAGADRVEGCLFGNGERTGNVCLITLAINLLHHGIDPELDLSNIPEVTEMFEQCTGMTVHERHPWVGSLVYTAFSGSHQDAVKKGLEAMKKKLQQGINSSSKEIIWEVPYLPIDPKDIGREYEAIVRINSQSGKGGVTFIMESEFGIKLPRGMQVEFAQVVQKWCDQSAKEIDPCKMYDIFRESFMDLKTPLMLVTYQVISISNLVSASHLNATTTTGSESSNTTDRHKRSSSDFFNTPSVPLLSPKKRDLGKVTTTDSLQGSKSALLSTTRITTGSTEISLSSSEVSARISQNNADLLPNDIHESPSSDWLVVDRPILADGNTTQMNSVPDRIRIEAQLNFQLNVNDSTTFEFAGHGNGPIDALLHGLNQLISNKTLNAFEGLRAFEIQSYHEMAVGKGSSAEAVCFIELRAMQQKPFIQTSQLLNSPKIMNSWGAARHTNTTTASLNAICSAVNRIVRARLSY